MKSRRPSHLVYIFRDGAGRPRYVGRGGAVTRPEEHVRGTHNGGLRRLIDGGDYAIEVAGPYRDEAEAASVESALITALQVRALPALTNICDGDGPKFSPLGVPEEYADRRAMAPFSLPEIGLKAGGALLVRLSSGGDFVGDTGRAKFDPSRPIDEVVSENIRRWWMIGRLVDRWGSRPESAPRVLLGVAGPPRRRYVVGALRIDNRGWEHAERDGALWSVPLRRGDDLDACRLRGRLVESARFGRGRQDHFIWVDRRGMRRYPPQ